MNSYELLGREKKIAKLLMAFDADYGHTVSEAELNAIDPERLKRIVKAAEVNAPSAKTIAALVERIRTRDAMKGDAK